MLKRFIKWAFDVWFQEEYDLGIAVGKAGHKIPALFKGGQADGNVVEVGVNIREVVFPTLPKNSRGMFDQIRYVRTDRTTAAIVEVPVFEVAS